MSTPARTVSAADLVSWQHHTDPAPLVVDVRSAAEFEAVHVRGAYHVPLPTLGEHTRELAAQESRAQ